MSLAVLAMTAPRSWDYLYTDPPDCNGTAIRHPQNYDRVLPIEAFGKEACHETAIFRLRDMRCQTTLSPTGDGMFVQDAGHGVQLVINGANLLQIRLALVMWALTGASYRDIAVALFSAESRPPRSRRAVPQTDE